MLTDHHCPECGKAFDPKDPKTFDAKPSGSKIFGMSGSVMTNISIILMLGAITAIGAAWLVCWQEGRIDRVIEWMRTPPGFRGNHGPWRRWGFAGAACSLSSILMFAALILAWCSLADKRSVKSVIVAILIPALIYLLIYIHGPLVD